MDSPLAYPLALGRAPRKTGVVDGEEKQVQVLHIITRLDPGGSTENTLITAAGLSNFSSTLLYGKTTHLPPKALALNEKVKMQEIPELIREISPLKDLIAFYKLWKFIRHGCFTIVHTHSSKAGILGRWGAWLAHTPIIVHTPHGHVFYKYFGRWATTLFIWIERVTALLTDRIVTLTEKEKQEHIQFRIARAEKFTTIPSGVDLRSVQSVKCKV